MSGNSFHLLASIARSFSPFNAIVCLIRHDCHHPNTNDIKVKPIVPHWNNIDTNNNGKGENKPKMLIDVEMLFQSVCVCVCMCVYTCAIEQINTQNKNSIDLRIERIILLTN